MSQQKITHNMLSQEVDAVVYDRVKVYHSGRKHMKTLLQQQDYQNGPYIYV